MTIDYIAPESLDSPELGEDNIEYVPSEGGSAGLVDDPAEGGVFLRADNARLAESSTAANEAILAKNQAEDAQAAAELAEAGAVAAETGAETAETGAEAAETGAELALANIGDSETNAALSETNAAISETNAATSETNAGISETNAASSASAALTSETNAATSETNAASSESASATSETNAATSETNAATSETNAATSETNAATSASEALTSETNADTSETNAATSASEALTSETNAATSETNAATSETNAGISETNAASSESASASSASAALTSETNAATSETNAATSETNAATSETNASTSESNAATSSSAAASSASSSATSASAALTSETNAATSETNAGISETNAGISETNAATSASNSSTSATNAGISETNAATSETNAAATFDDFDDRYLGDKASDPTLDNDGDPLLTGALYFNTTTDNMKVYDGAVWIIAFSPGGDLIVDSIQLTGGTGNEGTISWSTTFETLEFELGNGVVNQMGQEVYYPLVLNDTGSTILDGTPLVVTGSIGLEVTVAPMIADGSFPAFLYIGLSTEDIPDGTRGRSTFFGGVRDIDTSAFSVLDVIFVSPTVSGGLTNVKPITPDQIITVGIVTEANATTGRIFVRHDLIPSAVDISYDNLSSGLIASNTQSAIDELEETKASVDLLSANIVLYATSAAGDFGYNRFVTDTDDGDYDTVAVDFPLPATGSLDETSADDGPNTELVASFIADAGLFEGNPGVIGVPTIGSIRRQNDADDTGLAIYFSNFYFKIFQRDMGGTETLLGQSNPTDDIQDFSRPGGGYVYESFTPSSLLNNGVFLSTDRIVIKYFADTINASTSRNAYVIEVGGSNPFRALIPVPVSVIPSDDASEILVDTSLFTDKLSGADSTVQKALDTLDDHNHDAAYEPIDGTILKDADIGSTVQAWDTVLDSTTASFTTADETKLDGLGGAVDFQDFTPATPPAHTEGRVFYDSTNDSLFLNNDETELNIDLAADTVVQVRNNSGSLITKGTVVYPTGTVGQRITIAPSLADDAATSQASSLAAHDIEDNSDGYTLAEGVLRNIDTSSFSAGARLFVSDSVAGGFTTTRPEIAFGVGLVLVSHPTAGIIFVRFTKQFLDADEIIYDNTTSGLTAIDVQAAIDELESTGGGGGGGITFIRKTANFTASAGEGIIADTLGGTFTVTLPLTPDVGDQVVIVDGGDWGTTNLTVGRNGETIEGDLQDMILDLGGVSVDFIFDGTTWEIYAAAGAGPTAHSHDLSGLTDVNSGMSPIDDDVLTWNNTNQYWTSKASSGAGDMLAATYDPTSVVGDAFDMDNMVEGTTTKILTSAERTKLTGIETGATTDQSNAEIKTAYELNADTNEFSDAEQSKLAGIESGATVDQTGAEIKTAYEAETNAFTDAQFTKLGGVETLATADQSDSEIKTAYENNSDTNEFSDAEQSKLAGIESSATSDQTGAEIKTAYEAEANAFTDSQFTKLAGIETSATADQTNAEIKTAYEANADTNEFSDSEQSKLSGIETSATADQTGAEIKTAYEAETNAFTDAQFTKLAGIEALADVTDTTNVTSAGALMDSEVDADIKTLVLPASTTISAFGASLIDDAADSNARTTLGLVIGTDVQAFDADTAKLDAATSNFTGTLQEGGVDVLVQTGTDSIHVGTTAPSSPATNDLWVDIT